MLRALRLVVEDVADEQLDERALLLDHEQLFEPARELPHDARLHRVEHPDLEEADAVAAQRLVVEAELAQRLAQVVVRLARRRDAEPRVRRRHRDAVELVRGRERLGRLEPPDVDLALGLEARTAAAASGSALHPRPAVELEARDRRSRSGSGETSAVPISSATLVTILKPTQSPE